MWASMLILFTIHYFTSDPTSIWHGSFSKQLPNTQRMGSQKQKGTIKIKNPKNNIEKTKRREKIKPIGKNRDK
jgi:hypothetical protein